VTVPPASLPDPVTALAATPSLFRRMACWLYEGMLMFGVMFIAGYLFSSLTQTRHALDNRHAQQLFLFIVFGIYFVWFWSRGQTLAMKTWDIRITDRFGKLISQRRAMLRYVLSWLWFLPPWGVGWLLELPVKESLVLAGGWIAIWTILARFHRDKQFLHDALAGTRLISYRQPNPKQKRNAGA
jgi:uncharacterized RDD family membrane protein YckC